MSLDLDPRQRAMLQEMGVRVWLPEPAAPVLVLAPTPQTAATAALVAEPAAVAMAMAIETSAVEAINAGATSQKTLKPKGREPTVAAPAPSALPNGLAAGIDAMDWPTLADTVAQCQACPLCAGRRSAVFGAAEGPRQADWLLVGEPPDEAEERAGAPFADQAGQLLDNMLKALGLSRAGAGQAAAASAYVTNVVKCRPGSPRIPDPQELASCEHYLRREVALVQPKVILAMGRFAAQSLLLGSLPEVAGIPLGKLRGQIHRYQGIPVVVTYHPSYLLRTPQDKARAWADLCLALSALG